MSSTPRTGDDEREQDDNDEVRRAGPEDHGNDGGMATRENAPEIAKNADD
ncbi:hypothetical protein [Rhodococcus triatomae]